MSFYSSKNPKYQKFEKGKKGCWRYPHFTHKYQKSQSYDGRSLRYGVRRTNFLVILGHFLLLYLNNDPEKQSLGKTLKKPGDISILHMCTINDNHVMYVSWGMGCGGQHFLLSTTFWTIFCLFVPLTTQKLKLKKKENKSWRSHHFTHVHQNLWLHDVQFLRYGAQQTDRQIENSDI